MKIKLSNICKQYWLLIITIKSLAIITILILLLFAFHVPELTYITTINLQNNPVEEVGITSIFIAEKPGVIEAK